MCAVSSWFEGVTSLGCHTVILMSSPFIWAMLGFFFVCFFIKKKKKKCVYIWRERKKSIEEDERWKAITIKAFWSAYCVCVSSWGCWKKNNKVQNSDRKKNTFPDIHIQFFKKKSEFRCCNLLFPSYFSLQTTTALRITDHFGVKLSSLSFWCSITFHFTRISICQVWQSEGESDLFTDASSIQLWLGALCDWLGQQRCHAQ